MKVVTTNLRAGYVRRNGAPHSKDAVVTEYFHVNTIPNGDNWLTVTARVEIRPISPPLPHDLGFQELRARPGWNFDTLFRQVTHL